MAFRILRLIFVISGFTFLILAFVATADRARGALTPSLWFVVLAAAPQAIALWATMRSWAALLADVPIRRLAGGFYLSHLGKYMPGAIWQPIGQIGYAIREGPRAAQATTAYILHALVAIVASITIASPLVLVLLSPMLRFIVALLLLFLVVATLRRRWASTIAQQTRRLIRGRSPDDHFPSQAAIIQAYGWAFLATLTSAIGFALILVGLVGTATFGYAIPAYAISWLVGFLAVPFPAGLGVREAFLLFALAGTSPVATVIAASIYHRLVTLLVEAAMALSSGLRATLLVKLSRNRPVDDATTTADQEKPS